MDCQEFLRNPDINPITGRKISREGPTYDKLMKECVKELGGFQKSIAESPKNMDSKMPAVLPAPVNTQTFMFPKSEESQRKRKSSALSTSVNTQRSAAHPSTVKKSIYYVLGLGCSEVTSSDLKLFRKELQKMTDAKVHIRCKGPYKMRYENR